MKKKKGNKVFILLAVLFMMLLLSFSAFAQGTVTITACQIVENGQVGVTYQVTAGTQTDDGQIYLQ